MPDDRARRVRPAPSAAALALAALLFAALGEAGAVAAPSGKIAPGLAARARVLIESGDGDDLLPVIVQTWGFPLAADRALVERTGGSAGNLFETIQAFAAAVPARALEDLARDARIRRLSSDAPVRAQMDLAVAGTGALASASPGGATRIGRGVGIALLDSGVAPAADFGPGASSIVFETDLIEPDGQTADPYGHGTAVAGVLAGSGASSSVPGSYRTFRGVAPGARILSVKVLDRDGRGTAGGILSGIDWVLRHKEEHGIRILLVPLGHPAEESASTDPICRALQAAWRAGIFVVAAAGNLGGHGYGSITSPGHDPLVVTVGAVEDWNTPESSDDLVAPFSSLGPTPFDGVLKPDLVAPGSGIVTLRAPGSTLDARQRWARLRLADFMTGAEDGAADSPYASFSGTSLAAAMVAGAAAILIEQDPAATPEDLKARLMVGARKSADPIVSRGAGLLDIPGALALGEAGVVANATPSPRLILVRDGDGPPSVEIQDAGAAWGDPATWSSADLWGAEAFRTAAGAWADPAIWMTLAPWALRPGAAEVEPPAGSSR